MSAQDTIKKIGIKTVYYSVDDNYVKDIELDSHETSDKSSLWILDTININSNFIIRVNSNTIAIRSVICRCY